MTMYNELSGVYFIVNKVNGHNYIGSAINLRKRKNRHFSQLHLGKHPSIRLSRAYSKYGKESLEFKPVLICEKDDLIYYEQFLIDKLHPEYNSRKDATINTGLRHSDDTKTKLSEIQKGRKLTASWIFNRDKSRYLNQLDNLENKKFPLCSGKYRVVFKHKHIGCYETIEEARSVYKNLVLDFCKGG